MQDALLVVKWNQMEPNMDEQNAFWIRQADSQDLGEPDAVLKI